MDQVHLEIGLLKDHISKELRQSLPKVLREFIEATCLEWESYLCNSKKEKVQKLTGSKELKPLLCTLKVISRLVKM
jgi:hypothetical protein